MSLLTSKILRFILAIVFIALGVGMYIHPVSSDVFVPGVRYVVPHTRHLSEGGMQCMGVMFVIMGVGLAISVFIKTQK